MLAIPTFRAAKAERDPGLYPLYSILKGQLPLVTQRIPAPLAERSGRSWTAAPMWSILLRIDWPDRWSHVASARPSPWFA